MFLKLNLKDRYLFHSGIHATAARFHELMDDMNVVLQEMKSNDSTILGLLRNFNT